VFVIDSFADMYSYCGCSVHLCELIRAKLKNSIKWNLNWQVDRWMDGWTEGHSPICVRGTAVAAPLPFRHCNPALCGSCPLVTPYYCRLGDLLCYSCTLYFMCYSCLLFYVSMHMCNFCFLSVFWVVFLYSFLLQYFDTVGWVFWPVKTVSHVTYTVLEGT